MSTKQDFSVPRKKTLTTYGKAPRKRQPKTTFTPTAFPPIPEDDDSTSKHKATVTRRRPLLISSPTRDPYSPPSRSLDETTDAKPKPKSNKQPNEVQSSDRKRKISQVYTSKGRVQEPAQTNRVNKALPGRIPQQSRPSVPANAHQTVLPNARQRKRSNSAESMDMGTSEPSLSSPPQTPTLSRTSKPSTITMKGSTSSTLRTNTAGEAKQKKIKHQIPLRFAREASAKPKVPGVSSNKEDEEVRPMLHSHSVPSSVSKRRKRRLIDALVEQTKDDAIESADEDAESQQTLSLPVLSHEPSDISMMDSQPLPQTPDHKAGVTQVTGTRTFARSSSALKYTYGQGRKVLEEEGDILEALTFPEEISFPLKGRRLELRAPKETASAQGAIDDEDPAMLNSPNSKLKDIHELRQAGANSRVADTMQDLADQIGSPNNKPSSSRRAALLQVAEKIKDKTFMRQCRDYGVEAALLKDVGKETDMISGYLILSILVTILAKWPSSHIQQLVRLGNPAGMFALFLGASRDIKVIARDRKSNLSKRAQSSILAIQTTLRELPIWGEAPPSRISPRSLVLKCLHLLVTQDTNAAKDPTIFSPTVAEALFTILSEAAESTEHWNYPEATDAIDLAQTLSVLDFYAVSVAESQRASADWAARYLPIVADIFGASSRNVASDASNENGSKILEDSVLKLTINLVNNSLEAPDIFVSKGLIPALAGSISSNFSQVWASVSQDTWVDGILDSLVLRLGIMINFCEHNTLVRKVVNDCHHDDKRPVDELVRLFSENYRRTAEVRPV